MILRVWDECVEWEFKQMNNKTDIKQSIKLGVQLSTSNCNVSTLPRVSDEDEMCKRKDYIRVGPTCPIAFQGWTEWRTWSYSSPLAHVSVMWISSSNKSQGMFCQLWPNIVHSHYSTLLCTPSHYCPPRSQLTGLGPVTQCSGPYSQVMWESMML